ncbi:hypothetical protein [Paenibacillus sp. YYML68]|uniref:hypothetical protein n=1 Tax=Paenibacillus sp. YYML68 TaxID=2909250 RepID=UPI002490D138|nr:hypothetical protein [Paenibacillus sp. YYML68]
MWMELIIRHTCSFLELLVLTLLTFSLFRFPLQYNYFRFVIIALVMKTVAFYLKEVAGLGMLAMPTMVVSEIILITLLFNLPVYYSLFITVIGFLAAMLLEYTVMTLVVQLQLATVEEVATSNLHMSIVYVATATLASLLTMYIRYRKFGFLMIVNKMTLREGIKKYNFALSAVLIAIISIIQINSVLFNEKPYVHLFVLVGLGACFFVSIFIAYRHNKRLINEKYERMKAR